MQPYLLHTLNVTFLIKEMISIFSWIFHLYVATFKQHLLKRCSAQWGRLHEFSYALSSLYHEWTLICSVCTDCRQFLSSWFVCDIWTVVGGISMMNPTCGTGPYLPSWSFMSNFSFNGVPVACTKSGSLRFWQFSGCWLILSVYIIMSFDFPFVRLLGVR